MTEPRTAQPSSIRLVLVDDHRMFRSGVKAELDESMVIVGEAPDVDSAIVVVAQTRPDVVLLDVHLPGGNGNDLTNAIRRVADGDAVFSPRLAGFVLDAFGAAAGEVALIDEELDRLSTREREVMRLIARGYQYKEVAKELFISIKTVETHVSSVLRKLQLSSRHELTAWAVGRHLL